MIKCENLEELIVNLNFFSGNGGDLYASTTTGMTGMTFDCVHSSLDDNIILVDSLVVNKSHWQSYYSLTLWFV